MIGYHGPRSAADEWTLEQWTTYRDLVAAYLAKDPGWVVGPQVLRMCERAVDRLSS